MSKSKPLNLLAVGILVLMLAMTACAGDVTADDLGAVTTVVTREVAEGIITEQTESFDAPIAPRITNLEGRDVVIETNVIEVPEGTITERVEIIDPLPVSPSSATNGQSLFDEAAPTREITVEIDGVPMTFGLQTGIDSEDMSRNEADGGYVPLSWYMFTDTVDATCSAGVRFDYSSTTGTSYYRLRWGSGQTGNSKYCSGAQCNYTISTDWSAYYTYADAQILSPGQVWGPNDAYRCK